MGIPPLIVRHVGPQRRECRECRVPRWAKQVQKTDAACFQVPGSAGSGRLVQRRRQVLILWWSAEVDQAEERYAERPSVARWDVKGRVGYGCGWRDSVRWRQQRRRMRRREAGAKAEGVAGASVAEAGHGSWGRDCRRRRGQMSRGWGRVARQKRLGHAMSFPSHGPGAGRPPVRVCVCPSSAGWGNRLSGAGIQRESCWCASASIARNERRWTSRPSGVE